ncbi:MAG: HD domain-containing protein, partial [Acinetobacter sp.]
MVTVREQLPERLTQLSEETTVEHALQAQKDLDEWLDRVRNQLDGAKLSQLEHVARLTLEKEFQTTLNHRSNTFATGIGMANILAHLHVDEDTLIAAVLYRSVREGLTSLEEVKQSFGDNVLELVKGTLSMGKLSELIEKNKRLEDHFNNNQREHLTGIYKMLISVTEDVRVVLIKLAERTHELRELYNSPKDRQERVAREILTIYSPLAHRLGIAQLKWELEDLAFRFLAPDRYKEIATLLNEKRLEREQYIQSVMDKLKSELSDHGIEADINGRVKHIYSIYRKMKSKNLSFDQLYDIRALRVLVK